MSSTLLYCKQHPSLAAGNWLLVLKTIDEHHLTDAELPWSQPVSSSPNLTCFQRELFSGLDLTLGSTWPVCPGKWGRNLAENNPLKTFLHNLDIFTKTISVVDGVDNNITITVSRYFPVCSLADGKFRSFSVNIYVDISRGIIALYFAPISIQFHYYLETWCCSSDTWL